MTAKGIKGILLYLAIVLGGVVVIGIIMIILMLIFPNLKVFNYGFAYINKVSESKTVEVTTANVDLTINVDNFDLVIAKSDSANIDYKIYNSVWGFYISNSAEMVEEKEGNSIILTLNEPNGHLFYGDSRLVINLPSSINYNLTLKSNNGDILCPKLSIKSLNITTFDGKFDFTTDEGDSSLNLEELVIKSHSGSFNFLCFNNINITKNINLKIDGKSKLCFGNLTLNEIVARGQEVMFEALDVVVGAGVDFNINSGYIKLTTLNSGTAQNSILAENCSVKIGEITGVSGIKNTHGTISINTINSDIILQSENGAISVDKAVGNISVTTIYSDITVNEYQKTGQFESRKGNIQVKSTSEYNEQYKTQIINVDGEIIIDNKVNKMVISATGRATITVRLWQIPNYSGLEHTISNENGTNKIWITAGETAFKLKATGVVSGSIGSLQIVSSSAYQVYPNDTFLSSSLASITVIGGNSVFTTLDPEA